MIDMGKSIRHKRVNNLTFLGFMHFHLYPKHYDTEFIHSHMKQKNGASTTDLYQTRFGTGVLVVLCKIFVSVCINILRYSLKD